MGSFVLLGLPFVAWLCISYLPITAVVALMSHFNCWTLNYSKFSSTRKISGRLGMFILYAGGIMGTLGVYLAVSPVFQAEGLLFWLGEGGVGPVFSLTDLVSKFTVQSMVFWCLIVHFLKRWLEVLFVHSYSGGMGWFDVLFIFVVYFTWAAFYSLAVMFELEPMAPLTPVSLVGLAVFALGEVGNFYHHILLRSLRKRRITPVEVEMVGTNAEGEGAVARRPEEAREREYYMPKGGLFGFVACPHYLFEILSFVGISLLTGLWWTGFLAGGAFTYLTGRAIKTLSWYREKFGAEVPTHWRALIPFVL